MLISDCPVQNEVPMQQITEMMVRQCPLPEILRVLCQYAAQPESRSQVAFFLLEGSGWSLAAHGGLSPGSKGMLSRFDPAAISNALFGARLNAAGQPEFRFDGGWARHLYSGAGELLCMLAGFWDEPPLPSGPDTIRLELVCRLATLAIEQSNLIGELAFQAREVAPELAGCAWDSEACVREVIQMIAQQSSPEEILALLCTHLGRMENERRVAFFLNRGGAWSLAAKGAMTSQMEAVAARLDPEHLSEHIFALAAESVGRLETPFEDGWARHLCSGTGELLGLMVGFCGAPARPRSANQARIEMICRLASLAIEQTNLIEELAFKADHDSLTGLPNRGYYDRMLRAALRETSRAKRSTALLYINLDRFRLVNDVCGLATGNRLLVEVGKRFQDHLRRGPRLARMGADEFAVLVPDIDDPRDAAAVANRLLNALSVSFSIDGHESVHEREHRHCVFQSGQHSRVARTRSVPCPL